MSYGSASALYLDITGEDDYDDDEEVEEESSYISEENEDTASNDKHLIQPAVDFKHIKTVTCDVCQIQMPENNLEFHLSGKKHRTVVFNQKISTKQVQDSIEHHKNSIKVFYLYFVELSVPRVLDTIFSFVEPSEILPLRLVSRTWNKYLTLPSTLAKLYCIHKQQEIVDNIHLVHDESHLKYTRLRNSFYITPESLDRFLGWTDYGSEAFILIEMHSSVLKCKREILGAFKCLEVPNVTLNFVQVDQVTSEGQEIIKEIFSELGENSKLCSLRSDLNGEFQCFPLAQLAKSTSLEELALSENWFRHISIPFMGEKSLPIFHFRNQSVTKLTIFPGYTNTDYWLAHLFRALEDSTSLRTLKIEGIKCRCPRLSLETFLESTKLKKLSFKSSSGIRVDFHAISLSVSLQTFNMSNTSEYRGSGYHSKCNWGDNNTIKRFVAASARIPCRYLKTPPPSLEYLDISHNYFATSYSVNDSGFLNSTFVDWTKKLPNLVYLDISHNGFSSLESIGEFIANTTTLKTLKIFDGSWIKGSRENFLSAFPCEPFEKNISIIECDVPLTHHDAAIRINDYIQRNRQSSCFSLTKGAR